MADLGGFDAENVPPNSGFDVLPGGEYEACIVASDMKTTHDGFGQYLNLELQVLDGDYRGRKLFDKLNLTNKSAKAVEIARGTLSSICRSVGVMTPQDSSELHNKPLRVKVGVKIDPQYGEQNVIRQYKASGIVPVSKHAQRSDVVNLAADIEAIKNAPPRNDADVPF